MIDPSLGLELVSTGILLEIARRLGSLRSTLKATRSRVNRLEQRLRDVKGEA